MRAGLAGHAIAVALVSIAFAVLADGAIAWPGNIGKKITA